MDNINYEGEFAKWLETTDYTGPINLTAKFYVKKDQITNFRQIMKNVIQYSNFDHGALTYKMFAYYKDPTVFWLVEEWKCVDDLKNHLTDEKHVKDIPSLVETLRQTTHIGLYKMLD